MKELVEALVHPLVREPRRVRVHEREDGGTLLLEVSVAPADRGRVIGKRGRTVTALRTLVSFVASRRGQACRLEVRE